MKKKLLGKYTNSTPSDGFLYWWVGAACDTESAWFIPGESTKCSPATMDYSITLIGVRPVLEI